MDEALAVTGEDGTPLLRQRVMMNTTKRRHAEEAEARSRELLASTLRSVGGAIIATDRDTKVTLMNPAAEVLMDFQQGEALGKHLDEVFRIVDAQTGENAESAVAKALREGVIVGLASHTVLVRGDETQTPIDGCAAPIRNQEGNTAGVVLLFREVSERKHRDLEPREGKRFYRALLDDMLTFVGVLRPNGEIVFINNTPLKVAGIALHDVVGKKFYDAYWFQFSEEVRAMLRRDIERCAAGTASVHELQYQTADGSVRWVEFSIHPILDQEGNVTYLIPEGIDITERKQAEEERENVARRLRQAQKMEAIGQLAGGVAHDFNNILQAMYANIQLAAQGISPEDKCLEFLEEVQKGAERAAALTRQLLTISRRQIMQPKSLALNDVIEGLLKMVRRVIGEHIELNFTPGHRLGTVYADEGQMEQVLVNLCVNARDAMPEGGKLTIETENILIDGEYVATHPWAKQGRFALLSVMDTGHGMDEETMAQIFDPFFTTKDFGEGTGLGLATVYGIINQHDGFIHAYSEVGKGTMLKVYLPLVERRAAEVATTIESAPAGGTETILVAEDDHMVRRTAALVLEGAGYTVHVAKDGVEAMKVFETHADEISLVLLDVVMPKLSGKKVHDRVKEANPGICILFSSGYSPNAIHTRFVLEEELELLQKPYSSQTLLRRVREALDVAK